MAEAVKLLSKGVISVCKPSLDCDIPKEIDTKRSKQDADHGIIEIIDDLSCISGKSVIIDEPNQIPIIIDSDNDETPDFLIKETIKSMNKSTMTEDCLSPIRKFAQIDDKERFVKEIIHKTPDLEKPCSIISLLGDSDSDITEYESNRKPKNTSTVLKKDDHEIMTRTASNGRLQIDSNVLSKEKSKTLLSKLLDYFLFDIIYLPPCQNTPPKKEKCD